MMETGFEASFPLIFFDGTATLNTGNVFIDSSLNFKAFQSIVSQKIGVSPNQLTTYYDRGPLPSTFGKYWGGNRRSPVTSKFNFSSILLDCNCFFFVVLKRSRRVRHRSKKQSLSNYSIHGDFNYPELYNYRSIPFHGQNNQNYAALYYLEYRQYLLERERYLIYRDLNSSVFNNLNHSLSSMNGDDGASSSTSGRSCNICASAKREGETASFHLCNSDAILTPWFSSPFGPIARPQNRGGKSATDEVDYKSPVLPFC